jgi:hypothetical protein
MLRHEVRVKLTRLPAPVVRKKPLTFVRGFLLGSLRNINPAIKQAYVFKLEQLRFLHSKIV